MNTCRFYFILFALSAMIPSLSGACTLTVEEQPGLRIERYTAQRVNDIRLHGINGFINVVVTTPGQTTTYSLILPSKKIEDMTITDTGTTIVYQRLLTSTQALRREIIIPDSVIKTEQVRNIINESLVERVKTTP